jgi:hypothetical protein
MKTINQTTMISSDLLIEDKVLRDERLSKITDTLAEETLGRVATLLFAQVDQTRCVSSDDLAAFYEVSADVLKKILQRHRAELDSDGIQVLRGDSLKAVRDTMSLGVRVSALAVWSPRAALRVGLLLRDSNVARVVRDKVLDITTAAVSIARTPNELKTRKYLKEGREDVWIAERLRLVSSTNLHRGVLGKFGCSRPGEYAECFRQLNKGILGVTTRAYRKATGLAPTTPIRDTLTRLQLTAIQMAEALADEAIAAKPIKSAFRCSRICEKAGRKVGNILKFVHEDTV